MDSDRPANHDTIDAWVRRHQLAAFRFIRFLGCHADIADDIVQDALMAAVHKQIHTEPDARAAAWLQQALRNLWLMHQRSEGRRARNVATAVFERSLQPCPSNAQHESWQTALRGCLQKLDDRTRSVLERHYHQGASREQLATEFGMRQNGVKSWLRRVRSILRDCVLRQVNQQEQRPRPSIVIQTLRINSSITCCKLSLTRRRRATMPHALPPQAQQS